MTSVRTSRGLLQCAVALVAADSSIVVLAVPDLLARFGRSIEATAWTITGYNVAACGGAAALLLARRVAPRLLLFGGLVLFTAATLACAVAPSLDALIAFRVVHGVGAGVALGGAIEVLGARRVATSTVIGLAVGPALGGFLTQAFDWRAIFVAQLPVVVVALLPAARATASAAAARSELLSSAALLLASAALVAVLFLVVLLLIEGPGYSPIAAAAVVSILPVASLVAARAVRASPPVGLALLTLGLAVLALAADSIPLIAVGLAICGAGLGLSLPQLSAAAALVGVAARHGGVVLGLALITPVLAHDLSSNADHAEVQGIAQVVRAHVPLLPKTVLGVRLYRQLRNPTPGQVPDFSSSFDRTARLFPTAEPQLRTLERQLLATERHAVTDSFERPFEISTALAAGALLVALSSRRARGARAGLALQEPADEPPADPRSARARSAPPEDGPADASSPDA